MNETSHVKAFREKHLSAGERIEATADGYTGKMMGQGDDTQRNGALIVTNTRASFYRKGWIGEMLESIPLKNISSIERKSTLGFRTIEIHTSNNSLRFTTTSKEGEAAIINAIEIGRNNQPPERTTVAPSLPSTSTPSFVEMLERLSDLRDDGILTEEEFKAKKAEILSRI